MKYNDLDSQNWKQYGDIYTDSLWLIDRRDNSGAHSGYYHGNFVPQIAHQLFIRYTKSGEYILDPFMGSGTSIIEAQRMGRNAIGIELQRQVALEAAEHIKLEKRPNSHISVNVGDSTTVNIKQILDKNNIQSVQFVIFHPPYWDIIKFSDDKRDLSNCVTLDEFLTSFGKVINNTVQYLDKDRYCAVVIGDKYANGQIVPLGFYCMNLFLKRGLKLKAIIVKNFEDTKGKSNKQAIWRYRALVSDFYIFKHEYIFVFKK